MINSMTGFGRFEIADDARKITVELKSVNHKYLDVTIKMPRKFNAFEAGIKNLLKEYAVRGKVDIFITYESLSEATESLKYNHELAAEYVKYYKAIKEDFGLDGDVSLSAIARSPEVLTLEDEPVDEEELWNALVPVLEKAFLAFRNARSVEGEALKNNILEKLDEMSGHVAFIEERMPGIIADFKGKLEERLKDFIADNSIDEGRVAAEVTIYADKIAVDEELVRLSTHIEHMKSILNKGGECGRNLDFLAQEMNRESNTILSKANDIEVTNRGIALKTCIEKIREQVQNIE